MRTEKDPVCEAQVLTWWATIRGLFHDLDGKRYYFCSRECEEKFASHPAVYTMTEDQLRASDDGMQQPFDVLPESA